ncbi:MAG: protein kinase [Pirellulales bacterium]|nr:protein kinase [Pirellulales bacterium]
MAVSTAADLLQALEASNLLRPDQLSALRQSHAAADREVPAVDAARALVRRGLLTRWQAEKLLSGHTAFFLGKYRLLERVGRGGMGTVYKARHEVMGRVVALKVMARNLVNDADAVARFQREVRVAASLSHPHIVTAHDADRTGDVHFLVMEFVDGRDLHWWIKQGAPLPVAWSCECIRQVALGLEYARSRGLVHRDIKPSNLLVSQPNDQAPPLVKILDMGLARLASEKQDSGGLTHSGQIMGTPDYMAPEQAEDVHAADTRADIFSLGCTLFQMLTGQLPFSGATLMAKLLARTQRDAPSLQTMRPEVPAGLAAVVARMLARRPEDRYQTPAEVAEALAPFAQPEAAEGPGSSVLAVPREVRGSAGASDVRVVPEEDAELNQFLHMLSRGDTHREAATVEHPDGPGSKPPSSSRGKPRVRLEVVVSGVAVLALIVLGVVLWQLSARNDGAAGKTVAGKQAGTAPLRSGDNPLQDLGNARPGDGNPSSDVQPADGGAGQQAGSSHSTSTEDGTSSGQGPAGDSADGSQMDGPSHDSSAQSDEGSDTRPGGEDSSAGADTSGEESSPTRTSNRTLVVGVGSGDYPDLNKALADAQPGDTIRILHRGPLDFGPLDLAGKSPLTIEGGSRDGVDYWPILIHNPVVDSVEKIPSLRGLFYGGHLEFTLRKVHLVAGAARLARVESLIWLESGRVHLEHCTIQFLADRNRLLEQAATVPLVRSPCSGAVSVDLEHVFARGLPLGGLLAAAGEGDAPISVRGTQVLWAAGGGAWIGIDGLSSRLSVALDRSTLYNLEGLLKYAGAVSSSSEAAVTLVARQNLFVGAHGTQAPFVDWQPASGSPTLEEAVQQGRVLWHPESNVYHRIAQYYLAAGRRAPARLAEWRRLVPEAAEELEADPYFRVHPWGPELEECRPEDFAPRWQRNRGAGARFKDIGADAALLPPALAAVAYRPPASPELAGVPRGRPRVLVVHRTRGPYRTLEAAFDAAQEDDVIEIADHGPYVPSCDFQTRPNKMVLESTAHVLTVRAAEGVHPVIVLHPGAQRGPLPEVVQSTSLILLGATDKAALCLDGLHLVALGHEPEAHTLAKALDVGDLGRLASYGQSDPRYAAVVFGGRYLRCTNCTLTAAGTHHALLFNYSAALWCENCVFQATQGSIAGAFAEFEQVQGQPYCFTNCVFSGRTALVIGRHWGVQAAKLYLTANTILGPVAFLNGNKLACQARDNLVVAPDQPFQMSADALRAALHGGSNNGLWIGTTALSSQARVHGLNALLPGPLMTQPPRFAGGTDGAWAHYRLARRQPYSTLAADGGPVGARVEYLPELPAWMNELGF